MKFGTTILLRACTFLSCHEGPTGFAKKSANKRNKSILVGSSDDNDGRTDALSPVLVKELKQSSPQWASDKLLQTVFPYHSIWNEGDVEAMNNFERVCGFPRLWLEIHLFNISPTLLREWNPIYRGSDLFIKGLGSFDTVAIFTEFLERQRKAFWMDIYTYYLVSNAITKACKMYKVSTLGTKFEKMSRLLDCEDFEPASTLMEIVRLEGFKIQGKHREQPTDDGLKRHIFRGFGPIQTRPFWFARPIDLHVVAYFGSAYGEEVVQLQKLLGAPETSPQRKHLIKYYTGWLPNLGSLDELVMEQERQQFWPDHWENLNPTQLTIFLRDAAVQKACMRNPNVMFHHLANLPDVENLKVLRSSYELVAAGKALKNCAAMYASDVQSRLCVLVMYHNITDGKPHALGMYRFNGNDKTLSGSWTQIYLSMNRVAPLEVKNAYKEYTAVLKKWYEQNTNNK